MRPIPGNIIACIRIADVATQRLHTTDPGFSSRPVEISIVAPDKRALLLPVMMMMTKPVSRHPMGRGMRTSRSGKGVVSGKCQNNRANGRNQDPVHFGLHDAHTNYCCGAVFQPTLGSAFGPSKCILNF